MKGLHLTVATLLVAHTILTAQAPLRVSDLSISKPARLAELDMDVLRGQPFRLAWSPDGSQLYLQTLEGTWADANTGRANVALRHYLFATSGGPPTADLQEAPDWFVGYWATKAGRHAPDAPALMIDLKEDREKKTTTAVPMGGDLAKGGTGGGSSSAGDAGAAAYNTQWVPVYTMVYKGEKIGEFVNSVIVPGLTYGWGPRGTNILAFAAAGSGKVTIIDAQGEKRVIGGSKGAILPAWSQDGTRLAWLQKDGRRMYQLYVATISLG
jgi:hypothetical protein